MSGTVFKRCTRCGRRIKDRKCAKCGSSTLTWAFRAYVGKDADGQWVEQFRSGFHTKRDASHALHELMSSIQQGTYVEPSKLTVRGFIEDEWLSSTAPPRVKYETWKDRERNLRAHVLPQVGGLPLQGLNTAHLNRLYTQLLQSGRVHSAGGLSPTTVRRIHAILRKALADAVRWGYLSRNPATLADPPSEKVVKASRRRSMQTWEPGELHRFLRATQDDYLHPMWVFAATTGVRRSELLGLRWSDVDLQNATATVRQTVTPTEDGYQPAEDQKSTDSARNIDLDQHTVAVLIAHRDVQNRARRALSSRWNESDLVFPREDGSWWNPPAISLAFRRANKAAGVPRIRLHDLRHTHASLLLATGVNPKVVSERLGHSSVAFTLDTYAHVMPGMQPEAADLFRKLVFGSAQPSEGRAGDPETGDEEAAGDDESPENENSPADQEED